MFTRITSNGGRSYLQIMESFRNADGKGHSASPRTALEILAKLKRHNAKIAYRTVAGISAPTPSQLDLFEALNVPKIA